MPELNLQNIDQISRDVSQQEIVFSHLLDDLIDHICCDVEDEMQRGLPFSEAYQRVKQKMGSSRRLKEIQEDTLYAVDTKYRKMKNTMKMSGIVGTVLLGFATLFKVMHWPGAGIMVTIGAVSLAFIFMPTALGVLWKETHSSKRIFLFITSFIAAASFLMGVLFKIMHWPGAGFILTIGALSSVVLFIPTLLVSKLREAEKKVKRPVYVLGAAGLICLICGMLFKIQHWPLSSTLMIISIIVLFIIVFPWYTYITWKEDAHVSAIFIYLVAGSVGLIIPAAMVSLNLQRSFDKGYYIIHEQEKAVFSYMVNNNKAYMTQYRDSSFYPVINKLHSKTNEVIDLINSIELKMVAESEGKPGNPAEISDQIIRSENGQQIKFEFISNPFNVEAVKDFLLPGAASRLELETALTGYRDFLSTTISPETIKYLNKTLDPSTCLPGKTP